MKQRYVLMLNSKKTTPWFEVVTIDEWFELKSGMYGESYNHIESSHNKQALEDACLDLNEALTNLNHRLYD